VDERLHKLLAQRGVGSRRQVESWIREGRILVNGRPAEIGQKVSMRDRVVLDGRDITKRLKARQERRVIVYHKPSGEMLRARAGDERAAVEERLPGPRGGRWIAINALGYGEDGLLVLSNDGTLASAAARRTRAWPVEYRVRVLRPRDREDWPSVPSEIDVEGEHVAFKEIERSGEGVSNAWFRIAADQALPRGAVRALFDAAGLKVNRVMLVRWGPFSLPRDLPRGRHRELSAEELLPLLDAAGLEAPSAARSKGAPTRSATQRRPTARRRARQ
jgi:23S rRNA pseudouridine2605 synthase